MMHGQMSKPFNDAAKMLARALHDAGQTDREIADACSTSVNNISWWRKEEGLPENLSAEAQARAAEEAYTPPVRREPVRTAAPAPARAAPKHMTADARQVTADTRLVPVEAVQAAHVGAVQPEGDNALEIGTNMDAKVFVDLGEMLTTRLLIQGNSGSGKTHLLRRILEECAGIVQQVIVDPEGDFVSFGEAFGHTVIEAKHHAIGRLSRIAGKTRELRGSVVLSLEGLDAEGQMNATAAFLDGLFAAGPEHWHPAIVAIDEAHLFAPSMDNGEDKDTRQASRTAMANLMCRGRKRGLAGIIATQRLAKLHKSVAAEASNFLMGRTFMDIDIARAADLLGMRGQDAERVRSLERGEFIGLGPAIARRAVQVKVGPVTTQGKAGVEKGITPLPTMSAEDMQAALLAEDEPDDEAPANVVHIARKTA